MEEEGAGYNNEGTIRVSNVPKEILDRLDMHIKKYGGSRAAYAKRALIEKIENDQEMKEFQQTQSPKQSDDEQR